MRRCRVVGCFASSTQQMNSFRGAASSFPTASRLSDSIALLLEGLHVLRGQFLAEKRSPRDLRPTPSICRGHQLGRERRVPSLTGSISNGRSRHRRVGIASVALLNSGTADQVAESFDARPSTGPLAPGAATIIAQYAL